MLEVLVKAGPLVADSPTVAITVPYPGPTLPRIDPHRALDLRRLSSATLTVVPAELRPPLRQIAANPRAIGLTMDGLWTLFVLFRADSRLGDRADNDAANVELVLTALRSHDRDVAIREPARF